MKLTTAVRMLRRSPGFAIAAVATLALGIGANTAIFSIINATLLEPLPYPQSDRIVQFWFATPNGAGLNLSVPEFNILAEEPAAFEDVTAYDFGGPGVNITGSGEPEQVKAIHVSAAYFRLFGARVETGRTFTAAEDRPNGGRVVVLSHALWVRRFNAEANMVGKTISLGNEPYLVVGILAPDFRPDPPAEMWLPFQADPASSGQAAYIRVAARLRNALTIDQANTRLKLTADNFRRRFPLFNKNAGFQAKPLRETNAGDIRAALLVLLATVTLVLLMACSNVANLLLARATARRREIAIRAALGATRRNLIAQLLTENLILSIIGGVLGFVLGRVALQSLLAFNPEAIPGGAGVVGLDWRVLTFATVLCLGTTLLFGLLPAVRATRDDNLRARTSRAALKTKSALVVVQVAMAVVLVVGAGLMIRTFAALRRAQPGIDPHRILTMQMSLRGTRFHETASVARLVEDGVDRLERIPGVIAAATSWTLPVDGAFGSTFIIEGRPLGQDLEHGGALMRPVSLNYAKVFSVPLVRGRFFSTRDTSNSPSVAVISESMARKYWAGSNPIGERITIDKFLGPDFAAPPREIVGVLSDVRDLGMNKAPEAMIYVPQAQVPNGMTGIDVRVLPITWSVRTAAEPYSFSAAIQRELREASGGLAVARIRSMDEVIRHSTTASDFNAVLLIAFASAALLLAAIGIYGLVVFSVQQRTHEIGIRLALGASPRQVRGMVVSHGMRLAAIGVGIGTLASVALTRYMQTLLYGVKPLDADVICASALTLGVIAVIASFIPAARASRLDPAEVLRSI